MMILNGNNLGERHRDLNYKVKEAKDKQTNFEEVKRQVEECDVDKLFKIDLASRYRNIDYILEVLQCGDAFHITRALKCVWLYDDDYSQFINPNYLDSNIFPIMSMKMRRKMLTTISLHVRNTQRVIDFYEYCKTTEKNEYALKFLVFTPDEFKLKMLDDKTNFYGFRDSKFLIQFVGSSFDLAISYAYLREYSHSVIHELRFLYCVSADKYLNLLEEHTSIYEDSYTYNFIRLGIRITNDILKNHKQRIINKPLLYINKLNISMLVRYLTVEDVKSLGFALLPSRVKYFWSGNFYQTYKMIFEKIPADELFSYFKRIYTLKYNNNEFEMRVEFYHLKYYEMFPTLDDREAWALRHLKRDKELPGIESFVWYRFVSYSNAFSAIKRLLFLTPDTEKRSRIVNILPETARSEDDLIKILNYYYRRHINESDEHKCSFIDNIISHHDIYSFSTDCWSGLDQLFHSLNIYSTDSYAREHYKFRSLIYSILHKGVIPEGLEAYVDTRYFTPVVGIINELSPERNAIVAHFLIDRYVEKLKCLKDELSENIPEDTVEESDSNVWLVDPKMEKIWRVEGLIYQIKNVIECFKRPEDETPEIINEPFLPNEEYHCPPKFKQSTEGDFIRWIKQDIETAIDGIYEIRCNTYRWNFKLTRLFRKLNVYFPKDVGLEYLQYFTDYLEDIPKGRREYRNIKMAVVGVFYLSDYNFRIEFLNKYAPITPKIDHENICNRVLQVQKAICRLAYHSRPLVPLQSIHKYITGDYIHFCLPMFNNYFANMPSSGSFIESVLNAPLSIQKHGLRLAFKAYEPEKLKSIIMNAWKRTKNVSLRKILYETLFYRLVNEKEDAQKVLYEVLKTYTSELNHDDDVYSHLVSCTRTLPPSLQAYNGTNLLFKQGALYTQTSYQH